MHAFLIILVTASTALAAEPPAPPLSPETLKCLGCHESQTPGIVADWRASRHSLTTPEKALAIPAARRRMSAAKVPEAMAKVAVGCFECHGQSPATRRDDFTHYGRHVHVVVTPSDCRTCHPDEAAQYAHSKKAFAHKNLEGNPLFHQLVDASTTLHAFKDGKLTAVGAGSPAAKAESCLACHGTEIKVKGMKTVTLDDDEIEVPDLEGWPNHGVGRVNPDGSVGSCSACHARHAFSIEVARKPYTCGQCHRGPDVPGFEVWSESKHGNLAMSTESKIAWDAVPWVPGQDFRAPTCSACHNAALADRDGAPIAARTHDFGSRLWLRLFGVPYSHPQPKDGDTTLLKNKDGQPLPVTFAGELAAQGLIDGKEQAARKVLMGKACGACHSTSYFRARFQRVDQTAAEMDKMVLATTQLLQKAWATGRADKSNPFDEPLEHKWVEQWLFWANAVRLSSAMSGLDVAAFNEGWWPLQRNLKEMEKEAAEPKR